ncbi:MAG TPA: helix-turn-helix domain-containing protein [Rubrobacter sp.]|nr:helix-turn-helix domain-containing protein [Rubrobacter sp.]
MSGEHTDESSAQYGADAGEPQSGSGWTTTKQAAKALGVSRRSVQGYVRRGLLEATEEGEGVNKRFLVSIDSLNALIARRSREAESRENFAQSSADTADTANLYASAGEVLRHAIERLEARTEEATRLRIRLELTEQAESTLRAELEEERKRREEIERENEELRRELSDLREPPESPTPPAEASEGAEPRSATEGQDSGATAAESPFTEEEQPRRRSWWRSFFGIGQ